MSQHLSCLRFPTTGAPCPRTPRFSDADGLRGSTAGWFADTQQRELVDISSVPPPSSDREFVWGLPIEVQLFCNSFWPSSEKVRSWRGINSSHPSTYCNCNVQYIDMTSESGSTDFNDPFYEVRVSSIHFLPFCSQSLVSV